MTPISEMYVSVLEFLSPLYPLFGNAGFFIVPIFAIAAVFNIRAFRRRSSSAIFCFVAIGMMATYIVIAPAVGRYMLIPLLLCGCFSGAGVELLADKLHALPWLRKLPKNTLPVFLTVCFVACGAFKIAQRNRTQVMPTFAEIIRSDLSKDAAVIGVDCPDCQKLGGLLRNEKRIAFFNLETWEEAMDILIERQTRNQDLYFCVKMPKQYGVSDYRGWFRGMYSIFPFDMIGEAVKGKNRFILLKFNRKVLDGRQQRLRFDALRATPEPIIAKKWDNSWVLFSPNDFVRSQDLDGSAFLKLQGGTYINGSIFTRLFGKKVSRRRLYLHNELGWIEAQCDRDIVSAEAVDPVGAAPRRPDEVTDLPVSENASAENDLRVFADAPLLLRPRSIPVLSTRPVIHASGFVPLWRSDGNRIVVGNVGEKIEVAPGTASLTMRITDAPTGRENSATFEIDWISSEQVKNQKPKVLLVEDNQHTRLNLKASLERVLSPEASIDRVLLGYGNSCSFSVRPFPEFPKREYHAVVLNVFGDAIVRPWSVPFRTDPFLDEHFTPLVNELRTQYPRALLLLVLPPPPSAESSFYPIFDSPLFGKLSHFRICSAAERWMERHASDDLRMVPLYAALDPLRDYAIQRKIGNLNVYSGFAFTTEARLRMAEIVAGMIVRETMRKNKNKIGSPP